MAGGEKADPGAVHHLLSTSGASLPKSLRGISVPALGVRKITLAVSGAKLHRAGSMLNILCLTRAKMFNS
eukprot:6095374-Pyramimonas_sp.AAC.1